MIFAEARKTLRRAKIMLGGVKIQSLYQKDLLSDIDLFY